MPSSRSIVRATVLSLLWAPTSAQFCTSLKNDTWAGYIDAVEQAVEFGFAVLCPFEISGDGCNGIENYPDGLRIEEGQSQVFISCDPFLYGYNLDTDCIIDCPGRHLTIAKSSSVTLERMIFSGATESSIKVENGGSVTVINSIFKDNKANLTEGNGGAILALPDSKVAVYYGQFVRNIADRGGAIFGDNNTYVEVVESVFEENQAAIAGGAYAANGVAESRFETSNFYKNEASYGGALYFNELSTTKSLDNSFENNIAIDGAAIFSAGSAEVVKSTFETNSAEKTGGAIYVEAGSSFTVARSTFRNNVATEFGPAVANRFNVPAIAADNNACGNMIQSTSLHCEGIMVLVNEEVPQCQEFTDACDAPSSQPSLAPSSAPTSQAVRFEDENTPAIDIPSPISENTPTVSAIPSDLPSLVPSDMPSLVPSDMPSLVPSDMPSMVPSGMPSMTTSTATPSSDTSL